MTRHGKNATASAVYSYSERRKDASQSGYGTLHERLGADSIKQFDCCSITLQPCRDPVITAYGYLFDKEAILEYYLMQKKENARKLKEWVKQCKKDEEISNKVQDASEALKISKFMRMEGTPIHCGTEKLPVDKYPRTSSGARASGSQASAKRHMSNDIHNAKRPKTEDISNVSGERAYELPSFWIPQLIPTAEKRLDKPDQTVRCPASGNVLKIKELMPVKFTPIKNDEDDTKLIAKKVRYMCPITHDVLTNSVRCAYLKTSQVVVTMECVEQLIKKDMLDPITGDELKDSDIIELQRGGTGYSSTNEVKAKLIRPQLELQ